MDRPLVALVLAGGTGTRLYPASRPDRPKQFLALDGERSLLERTVDRAAVADRTVVATRPDLVDGVRERVPGAEVVVEPEPKDTGPALVHAAHRIRETVEDAVVVALPSDHHVGEGFGPLLRRGTRVAAEVGSVVVFGVEPTRPETGYGYVEPGEDRGDHHALAAFHEKPDAETAAAYVAAGHLWNAGIFAFDPEALLDAARDSPLAPLVAALERGDPEAGFAAVDPVSIDHAVLERIDDAAVVRADVAWDDLGTWDALGRILDGDADGNAALGDALAVDAGGNVLATDDGHHVSVVGVEDLAVVAWDDRVLVVPRAAAGRVREVVARLRERGAF